VSRFRAHAVLHDKGYDGAELEADYVSCTLETVSKDRIRVEMHYDAEHNCVKLRCPQGRLVLVPNMANEVNVHVHTSWPKDALKL
jgi:hypothetical protein